MTLAEERKLYQEKILEKQNKSSFAKQNRGWSNKYKKDEAYSLAEILSKIVTCSNSSYVLNPESPNSIMNEPVSVVSMLFDYVCYEKSLEMYNQLYIASLGKV